MDVLKKSNIIENLCGIWMIWKWVVVGFCNLNEELLAKMAEAKFAVSTWAVCHSAVGGSKQMQKTVVQNIFALNRGSILQMACYSDGP